jgi:hypothetical protein
LLSEDQLAGSSPARRLLAKLLWGGTGAAWSGEQRQPRFLAAVPLASPGAAGMGAHRVSRLARALRDSGGLPVRLTALQLPWQPR